MKSAVAYPSKATWIRVVLPTLDSVSPILIFPERVFPLGGLEL